MTRALILAVAGLLTATAAAAQTPAPDPATNAPETPSDAAMDPAMSNPPAPDAPGTTPPSDPNAPMSEPRPGDPAMTTTPSDTTSPSDAMTPPAGTPPTGAANMQYDPMSGDPSSASSGGVMPAGSMSDAAGSTRGFATYDVGGKGYLTPLEFARMMAGTTGQSTAQADRQRAGRNAGNAATTLINRYAADFSRADMNRDYRVTTDELAGMTRNTASR